MPSSRIAATALACTLLVTAATAQQTTPGASAPSEEQMLLLRLQQIEQRIGALQREALQDPELAGQQEALQGEILAHVEENDPEAKKAAIELGEVMSEARAAQQAGDREALSRLAPRAGALQRRVQQAQQEAMGSEEIAPRVAAFEAAMLEALTEIDAGAPRLFDEAERAVARLRELNGQPAGTAAAGPPAGSGGGAQD